MDHALTVEPVELVEDAASHGGGRVFSGRIVRHREGRSVRFSSKPPEPVCPPQILPAQVARMLALAHRFQAMIEDGDAMDRADLARCFNLTRARVTQILDLLLLAPDIQFEVLRLTGPDGRCAITERKLRTIVRSEDWGEQRRLWVLLRTSAA